MKFTQAKVIDNNDPDKKAKIKIKLLVEHKDVTNPAMLGWIKPLFGSDTTDKVSFDVPEKDSIISILVFDEYYLEMRYIPQSYSYIKQNADYSKFVVPSDIGSQTYPQPSFKLFKNGSIEFRNTTTGEHGWIHKNGQYILFDKDGNIFVYSKDKNIKFYNDQTSILLDKTNKKIEVVTGNSKLTLDSNTNKFKIEDGTNTIESSATGITINNNFQVLV
jgi:hypothetical protein